MSVSSGRKGKVELGIDDSAMGRDLGVERRNHRNAWGSCREKEEKTPADLTG